MKESRIEEVVSVSYLQSIFREMKKYDISSLSVNNRGQSFEIKTNLGDSKSEIVEKLSTQDTRQNDKTENQEKITDIENSAVSIDEETHDDNIHEIKTPIVGTFYRSSSPETAPFVEVGSRVKKDQTLCIVEAMKAMNEIQSDVDGVIEEILVANSNMVEFDQPLFKIRLGD
ncbi:MAG: acetyl-CoA carboxylase biotin carboxyl carrier protein [Candidatus Cloacimonadota bacterium]|nr:acetyl-CoA carboxylase biotin carboxyl carrier protein [Candidatus Cloacimonadota bacterium]